VREDIKTNVLFAQGGLLPKADKKPEICWGKCIRGGEEVAGVKTFVSLSFSAQPEVVLRMILF